MSRCRCTYDSPLGRMVLESDGRALTAAAFAAGPLSPIGPSLPVFAQAIRWLEAYFAGRPTEALPPLSPAGTPFQQAVWAAVSRIPYGETQTYGGLASELGTSARAVGSAVGRNPLLLFVPCHRIVGRGGRLTGYAGGTERKAFLLRLERD